MSDATGWRDYRIWSLTRRVPGSWMWVPRSSRAGTSGGLLLYVERTAADEVEPLAMLVERSRETMWDWFERFEPPVDRGVVAQADELFTSLTSSCTDTVLLHGDLGPSNVVLSERGWLAIDPYPVLGDRAFDVGHDLSRCDLRDARGQVAFFADRLDLDARRMAGWKFACAVEF